MESTFSGKTREINLEPFFYLGMFVPINVLDWRDFRYPIACYPKWVW